ncbi:MAG: asparagine synthase (glutamine-hydrolyzing) [Chthonomonadales bacterium]
MCGIAAIVGAGEHPAIRRMVGVQKHRGPDAEGVWKSRDGLCSLGHCRLSVIDLSDAGRQPMHSADGRYHIVYNGEVYNYLELRQELESTVSFRTATDTEVLLAAYAQWGPACLQRLLGMFAFAIWDDRNKTFFAARDRFGVKPLYVHEDTGLVLFASEIKALHAAGVPREPDEATWATYLALGMYDHTEATFWKFIRQVPPGHYVEWTQAQGLRVRRWYDAAEAVLNAGEDQRSDEAVADELLALLEDTVRLRFRADVPVGVCLSGGLDSSLLLGLIRRVMGTDTSVHAFTFATGDARYDEAPWVQKMLAKTLHPWHLCVLCPDEVPDLASEVARFQDEPYGGLPTLGMAKVHQQARECGVVVLLDGNGMDEAWAGYEYYARAGRVDAALGPVQGSRGRSVLPDCLNPEFRKLARPFVPDAPFEDALRNLQYRDLRRAKIPRAMRFADRVSMMFSRELREPFLDHRIVELGLRQKADRKMRNGVGKWLPRQVAGTLLPPSVQEAPKRPVQTPQREWLAGPLARWAGELIEAALAGRGAQWLDAEAVRRHWLDYRTHGADNSFPIWQWISLGMMCASL